MKVDGIEMSNQSRAIVCRTKLQNEPYRLVTACNTFILFPEHWERYVNGVGRESCDMLQGPCCCGAWHDLTEWAIRLPKYEEPNE